MTDTTNSYNFNKQDLMQDTDEENDDGGGFGAFDDDKG